MSSVFDAENLEAKDCGVFFNGDGDSFSTSVDMSIDENNDLVLIFENDDNTGLALSLPTERVLALLKAELNKRLES